MAAIPYKTLCFESRHMTWSRLFKRKIGPSRCTRPCVPEPPHDVAQVWLRGRVAEGVVPDGAFRESPYDVAQVGEEEM